MIKKIATVAALAAAVMLAPTAQHPAHALPGLGKVSAPASPIIQVRRGGYADGMAHFGGARAHFRGVYPGGGYGFRGRRFYGGPNFVVGAPYRRPYRRFYGVGYGAYPYAYGGPHYGRGCYWLKVRAIETGDPYWWDRYEDCRD